jgi:hypothetical protein
MTNRSLPDAVQVVIAQLEWNDRNWRLAEIKRKIMLIGHYTEAGLTETEHDRMFGKLCALIDIGDEIKEEMRELEDWLIDHNAPGWVAT